MQQETNRHRQLAEVVSLDVWHDPFDTDTGLASLFADVVFREARMGGEPESKIRFRLSLSKASLVLVIGENETVSVDKKSVARDDKPMEASIRRKLTQSRRTGYGAKANMGTSGSSVSGGFSAHFDGSRENAEEQDVGSGPINLIRDVIHGLH